MVTDSPSADSNIRSVSAHAVTWLSVESPTSAEVEQVARDYGIDTVDLDQALDRNTAPGSWRRSTYSAILLHLPAITGGESRPGLTVTSLTVFVGVGFVVTVYVGDLRQLHRLMRECETDDAVREDVFRDGAGSIMLAVFGRVLDIFEVAQARVERVIGPEGAAMFTHPGHRVALESVALATRLRLEVRIIRRLALSLREAVHLDVGQNSIIAATSMPWNPIQRRVERLMQSVDDDLVELDGLVSAADAVATLEIAREQRVLTSIAGLTLPVMAVGALLSMPGGNPLMTETNGYAYALGVAGAVFLAALFILQRRGDL